MSYKWGVGFPLQEAIASVDPRKEVGEIVRLILQGYLDRVEQSFGHVTSVEIDDVDVDAVTDVLYPLLFEARRKYWNEDWMPKGLLGVKEGEQLSESEVLGRINAELDAEDLLRAEKGEVRYNPKTPESFVGTGGDVLASGKGPERSVGEVLASIEKELDEEESTVGQVDQPEVFVCADCNRAIYKGDKYCNNCGKALKWPKEEKKMEKGDGN